MKLRYITLLILTFLSITSYAQMNVINVDTNITQVNITNYGNLIENNGGTVNIEELPKMQNNTSHSRECRGTCDTFLIILGIIGVLGLLIYVPLLIDMIDEEFKHEDNLDNLVFYGMTIYYIILILCILYS